MAAYDAFIYPLPRTYSAARSPTYDFLRFLELAATSTLQGPVGTANQVCKELTQVSGDALVQAQLPCFVTQSVSVWWYLQDC